MVAEEDLDSLIESLADSEEIEVADFDSTIEAMRMMEHAFDRILDINERVKATEDVSALNTLGYTAHVVLSTVNMVDFDYTIEEEKDPKKRLAARLLETIDNLIIQFERLFRNAVAALKNVAGGMARLARNAKAAEALAYTTKDTIMSLPNGLTEKLCDVTGNLDVGKINSYIGAFTSMQKANVVMKMNDDWLDDALAQLEDAYQKGQINPDSNQAIGYDELVEKITKDDKHLNWGIDKGERKLVTQFLPGQYCFEYSEVGGVVSLTRPKKPAKPKPATMGVVEAKGLLMNISQTAKRGIKDYKYINKRMANMHAQVFKSLKDAKSGYVNSDVGQGARTTMSGVRRVLSFTKAYMRYGTIVGTHTLNLCEYVLKKAEGKLTF